MKRIFLLLLILSNGLFSSTDFEKDKKDYFVHGQPLNDSLKFINIYNCFISNGLIKEKGKAAGLTNKGPYKVLTDSTLCSQDFDQRSDISGSGSAQGSNDSGDVQSSSYNTAIFDVKKDGTGPWTAQIWSEVNQGSTDRRFLPMKIFYDYSISRVPCNILKVEDRVPGVNCSKYGNLKMEYTYWPSVDNWSTIEPGFTGLGLDQKDITVGLGQIEIKDTSINYKAHAGANTYNLKLISNADNTNISKGIFERWFSSGNGPVWSLGYMFYADRSPSKNFYCKKYKYANLLLYKFPSPGVPENVQNLNMPAYNFLTEENKWGPKEVQNWQDYFPGSVIDNPTTWWKSEVIDNNDFEYDEICYSSKPEDALRLVTEYGLYDDATGERINLTNTPHTISATANASNEFPMNQMYLWASEYGVYVPHRYRGFFTPEVTVWKNMSPTASSAERSKEYTLKQNFIQVDKITVSYIALNDIHKNSVRIWHNDEHWNAQFKNLGFCGIDSVDKDGNACTYYQEYEGYYDKDLENDGNNTTKGGFVFNEALTCNGGPCQSTAVNIRFENSEWLTTMVAGNAPHTYVRHGHFWNHDSRSNLNVSESAFQNPDSNTSTNGIRIEKNEFISIQDLPSNLYCLERCLSPERLNTTYDNLIAQGIAIAGDSNQNWEKTSISGNANRSAISQPYFDTGPYIKSSEVNGSGQLEYDRNNDGTPEWTRNNAVGNWQDGIRANQVVNYTQSGGVISTTGSTGNAIASTVLSFDSENITKLNQIKDMYALLNGSRVTNPLNNQIETNAAWGFWNGPLVDATGLAQSECSDNYSVYDSSDADEYDYRPGWTQAQNQKSAGTRYCVSKMWEGKVTSWYNIRITAQPNYDLMDPDTGKAKVFDRPKNLEFVVPTNNNLYPEEARGKRLRLRYSGIGSPLQGVPKKYIDFTSGLPWDGDPDRIRFIRGVDEFEIHAGAQVTETLNGVTTTYKLKPLRGHAYLKQISKNDALALIGSGVTEIPYDSSITIDDKSILRDISPNGTPANSIGTKPTSIINNGNPCVINGIHNKVDAACAINQ